MKKLISRFKTFFKNRSANNVYQLDGCVPLVKAIPLGLQHVLAMFVANITPIILITSSIHDFDPQLKATLIQNAMFIAGIGTIIQLYGVWKIGARLPIVVGISFTFLSVLMFVASTKGYGVMIGSIIIGGIVIAILGFFTKYWRKIISPLIAGIVVLGIGLSLLSVGASSFGGGSSSDTFGSWQNLTVGAITLISCLLFNLLAKKNLKPLYILFGLIVGYIFACIFRIIDFSSIKDSQIFSLPKLTNFSEIGFDFNSILSVIIIYFVATTEAIGDVSALAYSGLGREATDKEISGAITADGIISTVSGCFGCMPLTTFSQNVGIVGMTKVVNRFTILMGAICMILAGLFPIFGAVLSSLPDAVLGGCTIMLFGSIAVTGFSMISKCGFTNRTITIVALSLGIGYGFSLVPTIFDNFPEIVQILGENCVATMFIIALILDLAIPKEKATI